MDNTLVLLFAAIFAGLIFYWQFSAIGKSLFRNFSSVSSNSVLLGQKGRKQQLGLIALLAILLFGLQITGLLF